MRLTAILALGICLCFVFAFFGFIAERGGLMGRSWTDIAAYECNGCEPWTGNCRGHRMRLVYMYDSVRVEIDPDESERPGDCKCAIDYMFDDRSFFEMLALAEKGAK